MQKKICYFGGGFHYSGGGSMIDLSVLSFLWAFLISVFAIPSIIHLAHLKNLLDEPNLRTIHESLTPRLGGLAIFAGFLSAVTIFVEALDYGIQQLIAGSIIIFFIGLKDDIVPVSAFKKFFVQVLAAGIVMVIADIRITSFYGVFGIYTLDTGLSYAFTFLLIIGITNSINLIDGLDGLAGSIVFIISLCFGIAFYQYGGTVFSLYSVVAFSLAGAVLGFLRFNLYRAIIFMGDTGSLVCGFIISVLTIQFIEMNQIPTSPVLAIAFLFIPIFDTLRVFLMRVVNGRSPFAPDKNHVHHILYEAGLSQLATVTVLASLNVLVVLLVVFLSSWGNNKLLMLMGGVSLLISLALDVFIKKKP